MVRRPRAARFPASRGWLAAVCSWRRPGVAARHGLPDQCWLPDGPAWLVSDDLVAAPLQGTSRGNAKIPAIVERLRLWGINQVGPAPGMPAPAEACMGQPSCFRATSRT